MIPSEAWNVVMASLAPTVAVGGVGYLLRRMLTGMDARQDKAEARIEKLEESAVSKEDWLRADGLARQRLEKIADDIAALRGQNQASVEIGAAIAAALNREARK